MQDTADKMRSEETLKGDLEFQKLISKISTKFVGLSGAEFEQAIYDVLEEIGGYFDVDSVRLYRLSAQGEPLGFRTMWRSEHLAPEREQSEIDKRRYPDLGVHYSEGKPIVFGSIDESPPWPEFREILKVFGTKAGLGVPLEFDGSATDIFAMDRVRSECVWPDDIVERVRSIGHIILNAVRRKETEVKLRDSYTEIKQLKDRLEHENIYLRQEIELNHKYKEIIGQSDALKKVLNQVEEVAETSSTVFLLGETGTGKELMARAIHDLSPRKGRPLVKVNCAALPSTLVESELFGREKGAYTGALSRQTGRFEVADGSTIFLDEISELALELQAKLLRVLQDGQFERLGSSKTIEVDVRVIAATNRDIEKAVREGNFREDLFYRLNVFPITVPPLRERREDIPVLVWAFVEDFGKTMGRTIERIPQKSMDLLQRYSWPGNIRELRNVIERAMIVSKGVTLQIDIPSIGESRTFSYGTLEEIEKKHIIGVLESTGWKVSGEKGASKILGLNPKTLESRMKKLGISRQR